MSILKTQPEVRLISITQPSIEGLSTAEDLIVHNARVSNPENQLNVETGDKLLKYCAKHGHWSVFEMADMTVEVKTSRAVAAQIIRHKSLSVQELSQRYKEVQDIYTQELRVPHPKNRQLSLEATDDKSDVFADLGDAVAEHFGRSESLYKKLLEAGVAKECARAVLPMNTQSVLYLKGSVRSWIHYLQVRLGNGTQKEHQQVALLILDIFKDQFPVTFLAIKDLLPVY